MKSKPLSLPNRIWPQPARFGCPENARLEIWLTQEAEVATGHKRGDEPAAGPATRQGVGGIILPVGFSEETLFPVPIHVLSPDATKDVAPFLLTGLGQETPAQASSQTLFGPEPESLLVVGSSAAAKSE